MSKAAYSDWLGLAMAGLEICGNRKGATNQNIEIPGADGAFIGHEKYGSVAAPSCDYKITGDLTATALAAIKLGKVHGTGSAPSLAGPYALKTINIHTGAGDEPTFSASGVQIKSGATQTVCTFSPAIPALSPARHALTFGAFTFTESASLALQSADFVADCEIDPTIINGVPEAADAVKAFETVAVTMWSPNDTTAPSVTAGSGWFLFADWDCTGSEGAMYVWTATYKKYLAVDS